MGGQNGDTLTAAPTPLQMGGREEGLLRGLPLGRGGVNYQDIRLGQPPAGTFDPCQAIHEGRNL